MFVWGWCALGGNSKPDVYLIFGVVAKSWFECGVGRGSLLGLCSCGFVDCSFVVEYVRVFYCFTLNI